jgi:hypothetical protein
MRNDRNKRDYCLDGFIAGLSGLYALKLSPVNSDSDDATAVWVEPSAIIVPMTTYFSVITNSTLYNMDIQALQNHLHHINLQLCYKKLDCHNQDNIFLHSVLGSI